MCKLWKAINKFPPAFAQHQGFWSGGCFGSSGFSATLPCTHGHHGGAGKWVGNKGAKTLKLPKKYGKYMQIPKEHIKILEKYWIQEQLVSWNTKSKLVLQSTGFRCLFALNVRAYNSNFVHWEGTTLHGPCFTVCCTPPKLTDDGESQNLLFQGFIFNFQF